MFQGSCTSAEQVFYKEKFSSKLVHVSSGKCVADPNSDGTVRCNAKLAVRIKFRLS